MNKKNFFRLAALTIISLSMGLSCSKSNSNNGYTPTPAPSPGATGNIIAIANMSFSPASKTVAKGASVKWTNNDAYPHTATSNDGSSFDSGNIAGGASYVYVANTAGTFKYHCTIHGTTMSGTLIVNP